MSKNNLKVAVVGATGLVGRKMIQLLELMEFPLDELYLFASGKSEGIKIPYKGAVLEVKELTEKSFKGVDIALFSAGGAISKEFAPIAAKNGCIVVDNSSAWRMDENVPLVVPEVNSEALKAHRGIIANPNCSTIQLVVAIKPVLDNYGLKRVVVSTYQSISGAGQKGVDRLMKEVQTGEPDEKYPIAFSASFHPFEGKEGFTNEEIKMINEPKKIMGLPDLKVAVTCVRLPILGGHAESVNIETERKADINKLKQIIAESPGLILMDDPEADVYPTPLISNDTDDVYVGRIRKDDSVKNGLYMWVVADNIRKGAATNTIQIAQKLIEMDLLEFEL